MISVYSSQFNYKYRKRLHLPYTIASLIAFAKSNEELNNNFKFEKCFVIRDKVDAYIEQCKNSDILLCSCYVWNLEITNYFAKKVKENNPNCLVIFGGPQIPNNSEGFFDRYPHVDIIVHGEGEIVLAEILQAYLKDKNFSNILGIETKEFRNLPQPRINDFSSIPSPYLTNLVWELVDRDEDVEWIAAWETVRGCPYLCTFCDWGSATGTKMRNFEEEKIMKEIEWFADNKISYIDLCDANFGIYPERDMRISKKVKEVALKTGYPETFHPTFAKFSSEKIIPIAKELQEAGVLRAVTLAVQSLDEVTLDVIKRANIKFDKFSNLTKSFKDAGVPTYTEIIRGLPGETLQSFKDGLETMISDTEIGSIYIYNCGVFVNAPMAEPKYLEKYKIKTVHSPIYLQHSDSRERGMNEYEDIVISTYSCSLEDIKEMYLYSWFIQTFQSLGLLEQISKFYKQYYDLSFIKFYEIFHEYCNNYQSIFSDEYKIVKAHIDDGYAGRGWDHSDPNLGNINWPIEEATWARLAWDSKKLSTDIMSFLKFLEIKKNYNTSNEIIEDLIMWNVFLITCRNDVNESKMKKFDYNWKEFFTNKSKLQKKQTCYSFKNPILETDPVKWSWKTIFIGRPTQKYKFHPGFLKEELLSTTINRI